MLHAETGLSLVPPKVTGPILEREAADKATGARSIARRRTETRAGRRRTEPSARLSTAQRSNHSRSLNIDDKSSITSGKGRAGIHPRKRAFTRPHQTNERTLRATLSRLLPSPSTPKTPSRSSSSDCTITQQGYNSRPLSPETMGKKSRPILDQAKQRRSHRQPIKLPNALDYLDRSTEQESTGQSELLSSSSPSREDHSDADVSEVASTPSSESTPPSPTSTEAGEEDYMEKRSLQSGESTRPTENNMSGNERLDASLELQPSVEDESEDKPDVPPSLPSPLEEQAQHPRPGFQHSSPQHADGVSHDYNFPSSHMPYAQRGYPHYRPTVYDQPRVLPTPWSPPPHSLYFHQTPPQHYPWPSPSGTTVPTHAVNNHTTPPASRSNHATGTGPPDNNTAPSKPDFEPPALYRRFAHLTHRILLSLQDELLDLEAHLQRYDEAIGTLQRATPAQPGSRTAHQPEWQHRQNDRDLLLCRAQLLAQIEAKMERYHRHLSTSASISGHTSPATPEQIDSYKQWIKTHSPSNEERLLSDPTDLIVPCSNTRALLTLVRSNSPITIFALLVLLYTAREKSGGPVLVFAGIVVAWPFMAPFAGPRLRMGLPANDFAFLGAMFAMVAAWLGVV